MSLAWFESTRGLRMESKRRKENRGLKETLFGYFFGKAFFPKERLMVKKLFKR